MESRDLERRAEIARRLRAARWLAGGVVESAKGKVDWKIAPLSAADLALREPLVENEVTASLIGAIERMERPTKPMELAALAEALRLPREWFPVGSAEAVESLSDADVRRAAEILAPQLLAAARALRPDPEAGSAEPNAQDPLGAPSEGDQR